MATQPTAMGTEEMCAVTQGKLNQRLLVFQLWEPDEWTWASHITQVQSVLLSSFFFLIPVAMGWLYRLSICFFTGKKSAIVIKQSDWIWNWQTLPVITEGSSQWHLQAAGHRPPGNISSWKWMLAIFLLCQLNKSVLLMEVLWVASKMLIGRMSAPVQQHIWVTPACWELVMIPKTFGDSDDLVLFALHLLRTSCTLQGKHGGLGCHPSSVRRTPAEPWAPYLPQLGCGEPPLHTPTVTWLAKIGIGGESKEW